MKKLSRFLDMNFHAKSGVCSSKNGRVFALGMKEDTYTTTTTSKNPPPGDVLLPFFHLFCVQCIYFYYTQLRI